MLNRNQKRKDFSKALQLLSYFKLFSNVVILVNLSVVIVIACKPCIKRQQCSSLAREQNFKFRQNIEDYSVIRVLHMMHKIGNIGIIANSVFPYICNFLTYDVSKCEISYQLI